MFDVKGGEIDYKGSPGQGSPDCRRVGFPRKMARLS